MMKMTYVEALENALALVTDEETTEKLIALRDQLLKRNAAKSNKPTKTQVANEGLKEQIREALADGLPHTVSDVVALVPDITTTQKATALLRQMVTDGTLLRTEDKRKAYFSLA